MSTEKNQKIKGIELLEVKKSDKANLESNRSVWLLIGFVVALGAMFAFLEWTTFEDKDKPLMAMNKSVEDEPIIMIEIPITLPEKKVVPPPPESKEIVDILEIVEDEDIEIDESQLVSNEIVSEYADYTDTEIIVADEEIDEDVVFQVVEQQPEFPGGLQALYKYLADNINYPRVSRENGSQGRVFIRFVVNTDGSIQDAEVIRSSGDVYLDREAVRVVSGMPKWSPGMQSGKAVRVYFTVPVLFKLQ
ncbi:MAG: energy transducer TonB [Bacteroidales bacterium]|nr:energy transducer TonB [Bacteroidales bacterium]